MKNKIILDLDDVNFMLSVIRFMTDEEIDSFVEEYRDALRVLRARVNQIKPGEKYVVQVIP